MIAATHDAAGKSVSRLMIMMLGDGAGETARGTSRS